MSEYIFSWDSLLNVFKTIGFADILDIIIVAFVIYKVISFAENSRAGKLIKGIFFILVFYLIVYELKLKVTTYFLGQLFSFGVIAIIVVFQPELRHALESVGKSNIKKLNFLNLNLPFKDEHISDKDVIKDSITKIVDGVSELAKHDVGALIIFEREVKLGEIIATGTVINADPSKEMIGNLFFHNAPLHDGAAIIRDGRLYAAGCFLPLSQNYDISNMLGTRHRAALGMSENSDAVCVVVSEETGHISMAVNGKLDEHIDPINLKRRLEKYLLTDNTENKESKESSEKKGSEN